MPDEDVPAEPQDAEDQDAQEDFWGNPEASHPTPQDIDEAPDDPSAALADAESALAQELSLAPAIEGELTQERDDRVSPLILSAAVIGMLVGLFVWGSLALSVMSSANGIFADTSTGSNGGATALAGEIDCEAFGSNDTLSAAQARAYEEQCRDAEQASDGEASPTDPALNREDCDEIRGTDYRSPEERTWFLANCIES